MPCRISSWSCSSRPSKTLYLQVGQFCFSFTHWMRHSRWNTCLHLTWSRSSQGSNSTRQMEQSMSAKEDEYSMGKMAFLMALQILTLSNLIHSQVRQMKTPDKKAEIREYMQMMKQQLRQASSRGSTKSIWMPLLFIFRAHRPTSTTEFRHHYL